MKRIFILLLLLIPSFAYAIAVSDGPGGWARDGNNIRVENPGEDNVIIDDLEIAEGSNWPDVVGIVSGIWGVHLHEFGVTACLLEKRDGSTIELNDCTTHKKGYEFDLESGTFPNITALVMPYSSTFVSVSSTTVILSDSFTTNNELKTRIPVGRVQQTVDGSLSIIDLRPIVSERDRLDHVFRRDMFGPAVGVDGGLVATEIGTRNIQMTEGKFGDERGQVHSLPAFSSITGLTVWQVGATFEDITAVWGLLQVDNINYNDTTTGGLVPALNNNRHIYMDFVISPAGGEIDGVNLNRKLTAFLFYGTGEFVSSGAAKEAPINLHIFDNSKPKLLTVQRFILRKNQANIEELFDLRPFFTRPAGTPAAIQSTASLQTTYENSPNSGIPEITTNDINEDLTVRYGGTNGKIAEWQKADGTPVFTITTGFDGFGEGKLVQVISVRDGLVNTGTTIFPLNNAIPQNTAGDQYMSLTATPKSATNKILITSEAVVTSNIEGAYTFSAALFQDSVSDAIVGQYVSAPINNRARIFSFSHYSSAGSTNTRTYKLNIGANAAGTTTFNGIDGVGRMGGKTNSNMTYMEIEP